MPIKLSGELVENARNSAKLFHRSLTAQIEHWATLGRVVESQMSGEAVTELMEREGGAMKIGRAAEPDQRRQVAAILSDFLSRSPKAREQPWLHELSVRGIPLYGMTAAEPKKVVRR